MEKDYTCYCSNNLWNFIFHLTHGRLHTDNDVIVFQPACICRLYGAWTATLTIACQSQTVESIALIIGCEWGILSIDLWYSDFDFDFDDFFTCFHNQFSNRLQSILQTIMQSTLCSILQTISQAVWFCNQFHNRLQLILPSIVIILQSIYKIIIIDFVTNCV